MKEERNLGIKIVALIILTMLLTFSEKPLTNYINLKYQGEEGVWIHWKTARNIATDLYDYGLLDEQFDELKLSYDAQTQQVFINQDLMTIEKKRARKRTRALSATFASSFLLVGLVLGVFIAR